MILDYLEQDGDSIDTILKKHNYSKKPRDNEAQIAYKDLSIWHNKRDLGTHIAKILGVDPPKPKSPLYKDIAYAIGRIRKVGLLVDWSRGSNKDAGMGIWRLYNSEDRDPRGTDKSSDEYSNLEYNDKDFSARGKNRMMHSRYGQSKFTYKLMNNYKHKCLLCGFDMPLCLIGAHIVKYSTMRKAGNEGAMNPRNGLLLCALCDKAFEKNHIKIDHNLKIDKTELEKIAGKSLAVKNWIMSIHNKIIIPNSVKFSPDPRYLIWKKTGVDPNENKS